MQQNRTVSTNMPFVDNTENKIAPSSFSTPSLLFALSISPLQVMENICSVYIRRQLCLWRHVCEGEGIGQQEGMRKKK